MADDIAKLKRQNRELKKALKDLCERSVLVSARIDHLMKHEASTVERGKKIAAALNWLDIKTDECLHFGLSYSFPKITKGRKKAQGIVGKGEL